MATILSAVGSIVTAAIGWMTSFLSVITATTTAADGTVSMSNPILLLFVLIPIVGLGIGLLKRLMHL